MRGIKIVVDSCCHLPKALLEKFDIKVLTPLPGTEFFREKINELTTRNYELFDFLHSVLPTRLPTREFYENMAQLYASTTMSLSELKGRVRAGRIQVSALKRVKNLLVDLTNPQAYLSGVKP